MSKSSLGQRSPRVLRLLQGLADRRVVSAMAAAGFTQADLDEGWQLLRDASTVRYSKVRPEASPAVVGKVDEWENYWYPLIDATLRRRFPEIHKEVFLNLSQESGPPVLISVRILLDRLVALDKASDKQSKEARALLKDRGLTKAALDEVKGYLDEAATAGDPTELPPTEELAAEHERAEAAMWEWYREWSQIARAAVKDGRLLVQLGLLSTGRPKRGADDEDDAPAPAPAPPAPAGPVD